ncbi:MAG: response regulator transcription factor [Myxococcaceae bacterium]|nr:response regulator transcription factor [Myxococcaceae bacterium]
MRVFLLEDDARLRSAVARVLSRRFEVVGAVGSVAEARARLAGLNNGLEVAVCDLGLPDGSGTEVIRLIRQRFPSCVTVAFTVLEEPESVFEALRAGARGYLLKNTPPERLNELLEDCARGGSPMSPPVARLVVRSFETGSTPTRLTERERELLSLLVKGLSYKQVALALGIGLGTVQSHVKSIYEKLEVSSKAEATAVAIREGLV